MSAFQSQGSSSLRLVLAVKKVFPAKVGLIHRVPSRLAKGTGFNLLWQRNEESGKRRRQVEAVLMMAILRWTHFGHGVRVSSLVLFVWLMKIQHTIKLMPRGNWHPCTEITSKNIFICYDHTSSKDKTLIPMY